MGTVKEIEDAVQRLSPADLEAFRAWFAEFDAAAWDRQIEADAAAGRLDALANEAVEDLRAGRCTEHAARTRGSGTAIASAASHDFH